MELQIKLVKGGMQEFDRTGIYSEYILFNHSGSTSSWRIRIKEKPQTGILRSNGEVVYEYRYDGEYCSYRSINKDKACSKWIEPEVMFFEMRD